ncbi:MAG: hypothetical protein K2P57_09575 [Burkholderiales bacterium]|nr:hypothetical protein [Burkholderiales bacterium]
MLFLLWIKNKEGRLVSTWVDGMKIGPSIVESQPVAVAQSEEAEPYRGYPMLAWVNPNRRGRTVVLPSAVTNANREFGLLVSRGVKYAKMLKLREGVLQLWTVPVESFDADWWTSEYPIEACIRRFLVHGEMHGASMAAMTELNAAQSALQAPVEYEKFAVRLAR